MSEAGAANAAEVTLSAERVSLGSRRTPVERVRVRREVVAEEVTLTVTVRREVLRIESLALATDDAREDLEVNPVDDQPFEVVLSQERPVVSLEVVPYERVRLAVRSTAGTTQVSIPASHEVLTLEDTRDHGRDAGVPLA